MPDNNPHQDEVRFYSDLLRAFFDSANDAIFVLCDEMKFLICNKMTQKWLGFSEDVLTQHNQRIPITELLGNPDSIEFFKSSFERALNREDVFFETLINPGNGTARWIELNMKRVDIAEGDMVIVVARDITQRKKNIATIEYKTNYDHLTHLPNRTYLLKTVLAESTGHSGSNEPLTLLSIDIDRFKEINESLGQKAGDIVLQRIAHRLKRIIDHTSNELLARLEGDEFVLILPATDIERAIDIAGNIKHIISKPIMIGSSKISVDCSIGIAGYPQHTSDKSRLIQYAESAMYTAKVNRQGTGVYNSEIHKAATDRLQLATHLRDAINKNLIVPYYQPILSMHKPSEVRVEALARWDHDTLGFISPDVFIHLAEEIGVINPLTSYILAQSIKQCSILLKQGIIQTLSVNISAYCVTNPEIVDEIKSLLTEYSISPDQIIFEITESAMMSNLKSTEEILNDLNRSGIVFSIDDFGTGHSSLFKLKQLPVSELKIDKTFVLDITSSENDAAICRASIQMAHTLGLVVVAEGIENEESWNLLQEMNCDYGQGVWMARPMPFDELVGWLKTGKIFF